MLITPTKITRKLRENYENYVAGFLQYQAFRKIAMPESQPEVDQDSRELEVCLEQKLRKQKLQTTGVSADLRMNFPRFKLYAGCFFPKTFPRVVFS
jgi:hypothetical protein